MESFTDFSVLFPGSRIETFTDKSVKAMARILQERNFPLRQEPLMLTDSKTGDKWYYNSHSFGKYLSGGMSLDELKKCSWCDGLYRNKTKLMTTDKDEIEPDCLFIRRGDEIILLDGDKFHTGSWNTAKQLFYEIG